MNRARPTNNVQWKGTDLCMDLYCDCGAASHVDGYFARYVQCPCCEAIYELPHNVPMKKVTKDEMQWQANPLRASV